MSNILRVTEIVDHFYPFDDESFEIWCEGKNVDKEQIMRWAKAFGTAMHRWCLQGIAPKRPSKVHQQCYDHWQKFLKDNNVKILHAEKKVINGTLYQGTLDAILDWDGVLTVLGDLKFWKCWRWAPCINFEIPTEYEHSAKNLAKVNLQTELYDKAQKIMHCDARMVFAINPLGVFEKSFARRPIDKYEETVEWIEKTNQATNF